MGRVDSGCVPWAMYDAPRKDFRAKKKNWIHGRSLDAN